ncbi:trypsin CFT-1-like [Pararge aegeria]|uniref:trypsin CFT-1-like n=1 Tax=Pararge aegeria TaxID=116150 RepID=UPI0019D1BE70|nr:trypsin CFT-1-like [Pararge aegeria]
MIKTLKALPKRDGRIVGGSPAPIEMYPFMASMQVSWYGGAHNHGCGGSLITRTAILSAAHCFYFYYSERRWSARVGCPILSSDGGTRLEVSHTILHQDYVHRLLLNDVAIVRLASPAPLSNKIQLGRIAGPNYTLPDNLRVYVAGWGLTHFENLEVSDELQHTYLFIINQDLCTKRYAELGQQPGNENMITRVTPEMMCSGILDVGGKDACSGDSGGPVVHGGDIIVGVTSWGYTCAHPLYPGVSARVPSYTQWIVETAVA